MPIPYTNTPAGRSNGSSGLRGLPITDLAAGARWAVFCIGFFFLCSGCQPKLKPTHLARLESMLEHGHLEAAETEVRGLIRRHPDIGALQLILTRTLLLQQRPAEALLPAREAARILPDSPWPALWAAVAHLRLDQLQEAEMELQSCLQKSPGFPLAHFFWGSAQLSVARSSQEFARAEMHLARAKDGSEEILPAALNNLGVAQWRQDRHNEAYRTFLQALEADPRFLPARLNLAMLAAGPLHDQRTALNVITAVPWESWETTDYALLVEPAFDQEMSQDTMAYVRVERDLQPYPEDPLKDSGSGAPESFDVASNSPPQQPPQRARATESDQGAPERSERKPQPYRNIQEALSAVEGQKRQTRNILPFPSENVGMHDRRRAQGLLRQAMTLRLSEPSSPGITKLFWQAIEADPTFVQAYYNLAMEYWRQGRNEEAIQSMDVAVSKDPSLISGRLQLADWLFQEGYAAEAAEHILATLDQDPNHPNALFLAAQVVYGDPRAKKLTRECLERAMAGFLPPSLKTTAERLLLDLQE